MATISISDAEWQVMNVIWEGEPLSAQEIIARLEPDTDWAPATIKTMLHRLVRKEVLTYSRDGNRYVYRSRARRKDCVRAAGKSFLKRVFEGRPSALVAHFLTGAKLTPAEIAELRRILDEQEAQS